MVARSVSYRQRHHEKQPILPQCKRAGPIEFVAVSHRTTRHVRFRLGEPCSTRQPQRFDANVLDGPRQETELKIKM